MVETDAIVIWSGDLLWPQALPSASDRASVIDLRNVTALGTWLYPWFRERPQVRLSGARPQLKRQLQRAALPVLISDLPAGTSGVSAEERALLFGDQGEKSGGQSGEQTGAASVED